MYIHICHKTVLFGSVTLIVFRRYTIVMIYYSLQLPAMLIFRPLFANKRFSKQGVEIGKPIYNALYFIPLLVLVQAVLGGIVCKWIRLFPRNSSASSVIAFFFYGSSWIVVDLEHRAHLLESLLIYAEPHKPASVNLIVP